MQPWRFEFNSITLGKGLLAGEYPKAMRASFTNTGIAGLEITRNGGGCNEVIGSFILRDAQYEWTGSEFKVISFAVGFEHHCEALIPAIRGTIYYNYLPSGEFSTAPFITGISAEGKHLIVTGINFNKNSTILIDDDPGKTKFNANLPDTLKGKKLLKQIKPGQTVKIIVQNTDGSISNEISFTRSVE